MLEPMTELALRIAGEARRASLVTVVWQLRDKLTIDRLLARSGKTSGTRYRLAARSRSSSVAGAPA